MFYILYESKNKPSTDPLVLWLTGGPGCSSELAIFYENGPFKINDDLSLKSNPSSWNDVANLLYVDNPIGTGFSHANLADYVAGESGVEKDLQIFLKAFLVQYPQYKNRDFYITGESYAGHYIPSIAHYILFTDPVDLNLKGIAIGDGWVDPILQYPQYPVYAYENNLIGEVEYDLLVAGMQVCTLAIESEIPLLAMEICNVQMEAIYDPLDPAFNPYDIRIPCKVPPLCYDFSNANSWCNDASNQKALGVSGRTWIDCN